MPEKTTKQKIYFPRKSILVLFLVAFISFSPMGTRKASAWLEFPAMIMDEAYREISYTIKGMIMGALKQAAVKMLSQQMDNFISGGSGGNAKFITDWQDYLISAPTRNAQRYANDYISQALSGRGSVSYQIAGSVLGASTSANASEGFGKEAVLGDASDLFNSGPNYSEALQNLGQSIIEPQKWKLTYVGDPSNMFQSDTLANMNLYLMGDGNGGNTIWDAQSAISQEYQSALADEKATATAKSLAYQGFIGDETSGIVDKPGILYKEMEANMENLPNIAMTSATSIGELVAATVSKAISGAVNKAVSGVQKKVNQQITTVQNKATQQVNSTVNTYGPGALYK